MNTHSLSFYSLFFAHTLIFVACTSNASDPSKYRAHTNQKVKDKQQPECLLLPPQKVHCSSINISQEIDDYLLEIKRQRMLKLQLKEALLTNKVKIAKTLIALVTDPVTHFVQTKSGEMPLFDYLAQNPTCHLRCATLMMKYGAKYTQKQAREFLKASIHLNKIKHALVWREKIEDPNYLLIFGAAENNVSIMRYAFTKKAYALIKDTSNRSVLDYSLANLNHKCLALLADHMSVLPVDKSAPPTEYIKLLFYACTWGKEQIFDKICPHIDHYNHLDKNFDTPLIICARVGFTDLVEKILQKNPDNYALRKDNHRIIDIALTYAASENNMDIVNILIAHGAKKTDFDVKNKTAQQWINHHHFIAST